MKYGVLFFILMSASQYARAFNCSNATESALSSAFTIGSTDAQTALGIIQVTLIWTSFFADAIFYYISDKQEVQDKRAELQKLREEHKKLRQEEPRIGLIIFSEVDNYLKGNPSSIKNDQELLVHIEDIKGLLAERTNEAYSAVHEED